MHGETAVTGGVVLYVSKCRIDVQKIRQAFLRQKVAEQVLGLRSQSFVAWSTKIGGIAFCTASFNRSWSGGVNRQDMLRVKKRRRL
jgi:hypothetical protein